MTIATMNRKQDLSPNGGQSMETTAITVTAIVPTFNRAHWLAESLDSLLGQSRPVDEVIVIDDGSTDATATVCASYGDRLRVIRTVDNIGKPAALNLAIPQARGSHIWIFDDDDVALPDTLEKHVNFLQSRPDLDFSYADKYIFEGDGDIWQRDYWRVDRLPNIAPENFLNRTLYTMNTMFQGMLIPGYCFNYAGQFDEALDRCEDHDMLLRLVLYCRAGNAGHIAFVYRHHGAARGSKARTHAASQRFRVMLAYRQTVFRRVYNEFTLRAFAPGEDNATSFASDQDALAMLQRACVMLHHGLIDTALADFNRALPLLERHDYTHPACRAMLSRATQIEAWIWPRGLADMSRLARVLAATGALALAPVLARGLYWQARSELRTRNISHAVRTFARMTYLVARCRYLDLVGSRPHQTMDQGSNNSS